MPSIAPPAPPYVGPPKWRGDDNNKPIVRIVVHCTAGAEPGVPNAARNTATYSKNTSRPSSWHYCADSKESVQLTWDSVVAYHCGYNGRSLGYEICCSLSGSGEGHWLEQATRKAKGGVHWRLKGDHGAALRVAAKDIARLCLAYGIPIRKLTVAQVRAGEKGLCGHVDIRDAFPGYTSHWDPGPFFPWRRFIRLIRKEAKRLLDVTPPPAEVETEVERGPRFVSANIKAFPRLLSSKARSDIRHVGNRGGVIGWQEIEPADYKAHVRGLGHGWKHLHLDTEVPISVRTKAWEILDSGKVRAHGGRALVSPHRWITWVKLRNRRTGAVIVFVNTHMISGAWTKAFRTFKAWRRAQWNRHHQVQTDLISGFVDDQGLTVVGAGDHNKRHPTKFHSKQRWLTPAGIDDLYVIEAKGGATFEVIDTETLPAGSLNTDHPVDIAKGKVDQFERAA